jgi:hypothetical protein
LIRFMFSLTDEFLQKVRQTWLFTGGKVKGEKTHSPIPNGVRMAPNGWEWLRMDGNGSEWMGMAANGWEWLRMNGNGCEWMGMAPNGWEWLRMDGNGSEWTGMDRNLTFDPYF